MLFTRKNSSIEALLNTFRELITATFTGPRQTSLFPKAARPAAPCATYCYPPLSFSDSPQSSFRRSGVIMRLSTDRIQPKIIRDSWATNTPYKKRGDSVNDHNSQVSVGCARRPSQRSAASNRSDFICSVRFDSWRSSRHWSLNS